MYVNYTSLAVYACIIYTYCTTQQVSWKVPADCVEALLAACLLEAGETAPQSLLKWLNLPILKGYTSSSSTTNNSKNNSNDSGSSGSTTGSSFLDTGIVSSFVTRTKAPVATADSTANTDNSDAMDVEVVQTEPDSATTASNVSSSEQQQEQQSSTATAASAEAATEVVSEVAKEKKVRYYPAVHITTPSEWALRGRPGMNVTSLERQLQVLAVCIISFFTQVQSA
jgi:hypothetical protein